MYQPILNIKNLKVSYGTSIAVHGASFQVLKGESVGIMGESGSGKTSLIQSILGLTKKTTIEGSASFKGINLLNHHQRFLGREIGVVFQDPMTALNPTMRVGAQIEEGLVFHSMATRSEAKAKAIALLELVGIRDCRERLKMYPFELSGGQRQRISLAIALACNPELLIADEPTTALDTTVQKQVLDLIADLRGKLRMSLIFISHDLGVISQVCDRVIVMFKGKIVEMGDVAQVLQFPKHPYTQMLISCRPRFNQSKNEPL